MNFSFKTATDVKGHHDLIIIGSFFSKNSSSQTPKKTSTKAESSLDTSSWDKSFFQAFKKLKTWKSFQGKQDETFLFPLENGTLVLALGLGEMNQGKNKEEVDGETFRRSLSKIYRDYLGKNLYKDICFDLNTFPIFTDTQQCGKIFGEALGLSSYKFDKYQTTNNNHQKNNNTPILITLVHRDSKSLLEIKKGLQLGKTYADCVNLARDLINEVPNVLNSEVFAQEIQKDQKDVLKKVQIKVLNKAQIKKEQMNLLLAVNAGSAYEPRVVHLSYTPSKITKNTKHIALVGKGLTFDTGGYSIKPGPSLMGMKVDMAGAASVYGAFRTAVLLNSPHKISCFMGMTDNMISSHAIVPDSVVKGRAGKTVEILNTDAEGRLVLADVLDYACSQKPDIIIDVATLTGACVRALGAVCGLMGNDEGLNQKLLKHAKIQGERMWELPIYPEYREDIKSKVGDIKNLGGNGNAGAQKAAAFLEHFIKPGILWAHLDIAGISDSITHLPYCPSHGASGLIVRTLASLLTNEEF